MHVQSSEKGNLHGSISGVAREQKQVPWLDHPGEPHEHAGVGAQGHAHPSTNLLNWLIIIEHTGNN